MYANLSDTDNDWDIERQRDGQVLFRHADEASVASDHEYDAGRRSGGQAVQCGFEIAFVSGKICKHVSAVLAGEMGLTAYR